MPVECFPIADKITSLPGQPKVAFQQFAGYITVDEKQQRALFYYFVEAEAEPASRPLVLWLNGGIFAPLTCISRLTQQTLKLLLHFLNILLLFGLAFSHFVGPGCSSVGAGAFIEHGPFKPSGDNLLRNEYSWNKGLSNVYVLPFCVRNKSPLP